jgi:GMP synthase-like glutamine amidotransferase
MKLLLSQREIVVKNSMGVEMTLDALERDWHKFLHKHEILTYPNVIDVDSNIDFDCLILTGGPDSFARHYTENALFDLALKKQKPVVGICHGAFVINDQTGGQNGHIPGHEACWHDVTMDSVKYRVNSHHSQSIESLGPDMVAVAVDEDGNIEAFQHCTKQIYGVVWHPERMPDLVLPVAVKNLLF